MGKESLAACALLVALSISARAEQKVDPRLAPIQDWLKAGLIDSFGIDRPLATIRVTARFSGLPLEKQADIAKRTCTILSLVSQDAQKGRDAGPDDPGPVGTCDVSRVGGVRLASVGFDDDGNVGLEWEQWYAREMIRAKK